MGILGRALVSIGLAEEVEDVRPGAAAAAPAAPVRAVAQPTQMASPLVGSVAATIRSAAPLGTDPSVLAKFEHYFDELFEKSNLPGPDYFEFEKTMDTLSLHIPDTGARMAAAFAALLVQDPSKTLNKQRLLDTAAQYIAIVEADKTAFEGSVASSRMKKVGPLETELTSIEQGNADAERRIAELQQSMEASKQRAAELRNLIEVEENKLAGNRAGYGTACAAMVEKIRKDIADITAHLK